MPKVNPIEAPRFCVQGFYRPASKTGGDWWWYERSDAKITIVVGDVTGHGSGPAMVTAAAAAAFRVQDADPNVTLDTRLRRCNAEVLRVAGGEYLMTMSVLELELATGNFTLYSAGGQPVLRLIYDGTPRLLSCAGTPLGSPQLELGRIVGRMTSGERFVFFTDGIPEITLDGGRQLGMRRFSNMCEQTAGLSLQAAVAQIVESADSSRKQGPQADDWTLVVLEWRG